MKTFLSIMLILMLATLIIPLVMAQAPADSTGVPGPPPEGFEGLFYVLQILLSFIVVPLVAFIKNKFIPDNLSFMSWVIQALICLLLAWLLALIMVPNYTWMQLLQIVLLIMGVSSGVHAGVKTKRNYATA